MVLQNFTVSLYHLWNPRSATMTTTSVPRGTPTTVLHSTNTTTHSRNNPESGNDNDNDIFLWLPLIFVIVFAMIIILLIFASRFSFRCCFRSDSRRRSSRGNCRQFVSTFAYHILYILRCDDYVSMHSKAGC